MTKTSKATAKTAPINWTKTGSNRSHATGVTIVKTHPAMTAYAVLVPGAEMQRFGSFAAAKAAADRAVRALQAK